MSALAATIALPFEIEICGAFTVFTGFLVFVFRDPERIPGNGFVSPADGTVRDVDEGKGYVSIYLALRNVHVTRAPTEGTVTAVERAKGAHAPAFSKRTEGNERVEMTFSTAAGDVRIVQMVGALARRIVPYVIKGQTISKAERLSLIRFGSRVDIFLPAQRARIVAKRGQKVRAGTTCIAEVIDVEV